MDDLQSLSDIPDASEPNGIENWLEAKSAELAELIAVELLKITTEAYEAFIATVDETVVTANGDLNAIDSIPGKWNVVAQSKVVPQITQTFLSGALFAYAAADNAQTIPPSEATAWANVVNQQAVEYAMQATNRLRDVGNTVWNDIRKKVSKSIAAGNSTEMLKQELEQLGRFSEYRADTIARTETSGAYINGNWNADQALGKYGPVEKVWVVVGDARTRPTHFAVAESSRANPVPFNEPFTVGGVQMMYPHSPGAPAGEVVNCRCYYDSYYLGEKRPDGSIVSLADQKPKVIPQEQQATPTDPFAFQSAPFSENDFLDNAQQLLQEANENTKRVGRLQGDQNLRVFLQRQGFTAKPTVVPANKFDELVDANDLTTIYRGVGGGKEKEFVDEFVDGELFSGYGIFGNGTYTSTRIETALSYSDTAEGVITMALKPDAKIISYDEIASITDFLDPNGKDDTFAKLLYDKRGLNKARTEVIDSLSDTSLRPWDEVLADVPADIANNYRNWEAMTELVGTDPSIYATMAGYDAILVPRRNGEFFYVVLNRGALIVKGK